MRKLVVRNDQKQEKKIVYLFDDGIKITNKIGLIDKIKSYCNQVPSLEPAFVLGLERCLKTKEYTRFMTAYNMYNVKVEEEKAKQMGLFTDLSYQENLVKEKFLLPVSVAFRPYAVNSDYEKFINLDVTRWLNFYLYNYLPYLRFDFDEKFVCFESDTHRFIFNFQLLLSNDQYVEKLYKIMLYHAVENFDELAVPGIDLQFQASQPVRVEWANFISGYIDMFIKNEFGLLSLSGIYEFHFLDSSQIENFFKASAKHFGSSVNLNLAQIENFLNSWVSGAYISSSLSDPERKNVPEKEFFYNPTWLYKANELYILYYPNIIIF